MADSTIQTIGVGSSYIPTTSVNGSGVLNSCNSNKPMLANSRLVWQPPQDVFVNPYSTAVNQLYDTAAASNPTISSYDKMKALRGEPEDIGHKLAYAYMDASINTVKSAMNPFYGNKRTMDNMDKWTPKIQTFLCGAGPQTT